MKIEKPGLEPNHPTQTEQARSANQNRVQKAGKPQRSPQKTEPAVDLSQKDKATLSDRARLLSQASKKLGEIPEARAERVAELKARLDDGSYEIPFESLAKLLLSHLR